mgnify:CR=1 FL=1
MTIDKNKIPTTEIVGQDLAGDIAGNLARAIASSHMMFYAKEGEISLLTAPARVLITLILQPGMTRRAISIYLGVTEAAIQKSINTLMKYGLIAKTKVGSKNFYDINTKMLLETSDISHIVSALNVITPSEKNSDPF